MRRQAIFLGHLLAAVVLVQAQPDSVFRDLDRLGMQDLLLGDSFLVETQVSGASRSLQDVSELPFPIYVIHREEILSQGYITLVDALKSMPGIRVSQPGSGLEGELFTMRGLLGNTYAKILVNGHPIKPYVVSGMPIGAQLPIQQAERIEVIYGPAAALYGADASSGIINIVVADSERPLFTKASLHLGSDNYKSLNLLFGGKMGRGDDVVRFKLYGTDTRFEDRRTFYDEDRLYRTSNYIGLATDSASVFGDANYRGRSGIPARQNMPHESRALGGELNYRFLTISVLNMFRRDHSSIGLNPTAVSYANPLISTGENITSGLARAQFQVGNVFLETKMEYLGYNLDNRSTNVFIHPVLNALLYNTITDSTNLGAIRTGIDNNFFSGLRFMGAVSDEYSLEQTADLPVFSGGSLTIGLKYLRGDGHALRELQPGVINFDRSDPTNLMPTSLDESIQEGSLFFQLFQPLGAKANLLVGGQYLNRSNGDFAERTDVFSPRLALLYKWSDRVQLRASYSTAIRAPSPFFSASSYSYREGIYDFLVTGAERLDAEKTRSYELGMRWDHGGRWDLDVSASYTKTDRFVNYSILFERIGPGRRLRAFTLGYFNDDNSAAELFDLQAHLRARDLVSSIRLGGSLNVNYSAGTESLTTTDLTELNNDPRQLDDLRAHPNLIARLSLHASPFARFLVRVDQYLTSKSLTRNSFRLSGPGRGVIAPSLYNDGYYTVDLSCNYEVSKNFLIYLKGTNLLNTGYAGIDASSSTDILFYNPQSLFTFRIGLNYELH